ncbi:GPI-N-acetylgalactosamine transferase PGAP4-like isoform X2 [Branchiostoma floridae x Branchiostoma japonicum]
MYYRFAALYFITYVIALPLLCWDMRYSMYFRYDVMTDRQKHLDRAIEENQQRIAEAEEYLRKHGPRHRVFRRLNLMVLKRVQPQIVITVVTIARQPQNGVNKHRYLTQVVTQFAELLEHEEAADVVFQVCNVNVPPEAHHEAVFLSKYIPIVQRESNEEQTEEEDPFEREKLDYIFCLEKSVELNPEYVLMVEDDALPTPNILHVLRHKLQYRLKLRIRQGEFVHHSDDWAFLKLYDIERLQGYGNDARSFIELTGAGLLGGTAFLLILQRRGHKTQRRVVIFALGFVYVVLLCWAIGRQYFLQLRRFSAQLYTVTTGPFCCTPAVVYPVKMAAEIAAFLKTGTCDERYPLDFALSDFAIDKGLTRYKVEPNLVLHVGLVSSIRADVRDPLE